MIQLRKRKDIFHIEGGWFSGDWHFSFDNYYDPENTHFGKLRVFNVDTIIPGAVWPMHPHQEMEVITYCTQGVFEHADDLGNDGLLYPGDVQHTTIGSGMMHSEINHSKTEPMTFIQVWIFPWKQGLTPRVQQKHVKKEERLNRFLPLVSNRAHVALPIEQDAEAFAAALESGVQIRKNLGREQGAYLYLISGAVLVNGTALAPGDAVKMIDEPVAIEATEPSELFMLMVPL